MSVGGRRSWKTRRVVRGDPQPLPKMPGQVGVGGGRGSGPKGLEGWQAASKWVMCWRREAMEVGGGRAAGGGGVG
jgi:hypothetical protein